MFSCFVKRYQLKEIKKMKSDICHIEKQLDDIKSELRSKKVDRSTIVLNSIAVVVMTIIGGGILYFSDYFVSRGILGLKIKPEYIPILSFQLAAMFSSVLKQPWNRIVPVIMISLSVISIAVFN